MTVSPTYSTSIVISRLFFCLWLLLSFKIWPSQLLWSLRALVWNAIKWKLYASYNHAAICPHVRVLSLYNWVFMECSKTSPMCYLTIRLSSSVVIEWRYYRGSLVYQNYKLTARAGHPDTQIAESVTLEPLIRIFKRGCKTT